ncbi:MAG: hypothetical protein V3U68_06640 [Bacteroidota bacterium]
MALEERRQPKGSIVLKIVIVVLVAVLVWVIYEPYAYMKQESAFKLESRLRMVNIRQAELLYLNRNGRYSSNLDSLILFIKTDTAIAARMDSIFKPLSDGTFNPEFLKYTPKSHRSYNIQVDDTSAVKKYFLEDPDGYGTIGSLDDEKKVNKASWEE